jgi:hypothetical protein
VIALTAAVVTVGSCGRDSPTAPSPIQATLTGRWVGTFANQFGGPGGILGDWRRFVLNLQVTGGDEIVTNDGQHFPIDDNVRSGQRILDVVFTPFDGCVSVALVIQSIHVDDTGTVDGFSGFATGRCPNTIETNFAFTRG